MIARLKRALILLGVSRSNFVRMATSLPSDRLARLNRTLRRPPLSVVLAPLLRWLRSGPIVIDAGLATGLLVATPDVPMAHSQSGLIVRGVLEVPVQEALRRTLPTGGVLYDVGANVGFFSMLAARIVGQNGRVYAFEPAPRNAEAIRRGAAANEFANIEVIERAAFEHSGSGRLQLVEDLSWSKLEDAGPHELTETVVEVELVAVDDLVGRGELRAPDVVKIDVEGAELEVLRGMRKTIAEHSPVIVCELHDTAPAFEALMAEFGYVVENVEGPWPLSESPDQGHALARPAGSD